ncbi:MAG: adenosylcobinamide-GDP ribazoletransferase [Clostridiales bacterium GWC2_40_7]|nr:MAG: adenosylcobinamide-GDP ribazoletransferase [Clostridiales bacterium GWC2_40_7]
MRYLKRFVLMIQFLTTLPIRTKLNVTAEDFGKGLVFAPIIGLLIGGILAGAWYVLAMMFPSTVTAVLIIILYIVLTGGLHLDGLGDTFDGLYSNRSRERMLEIMRDSRVGTNAVLAVIAVLLLNTALLASFNKSDIFIIILLMPVAGRIGSLVGSGVSSYARSGEGLGKSFIDFCGGKEIIAGIVPYLVIFYLSAGIQGLMLSIIPPVCAFILIKMFSRKIGGATGDLLGAVCELNQTIFLLSAFLIIKFMGGMA